MSTRSLFDRVRGALEDHECSPKVRGDQITARCPAHDDSEPSLSVRYSRAAGKVLLRCHAGCRTEEIVAALGMVMADLFDPRKSQQDRVRRQEIVAVYEYTDAVGRPLFQKLRFGPVKRFKIRRSDGRGGWIWNLDDTPRVLFRLPAVKAAIKSGTRILLPEGEKDVLAAEAAGYVATTSHEGAAKPEQTPKWRPEHTEALRGADVLVIADNDAPGIAHARAVAAALHGVAVRVEVVRPALDFEGADLTDHLEAGHTIDELVPLDGLTTARAAGAGADAEPPAPTPLKRPRVPMEFPADALPGWAAQWVRAEATATQTPLDLAGTCVLGVLAACAGGRVEVEARPGWREPSNLYALPVMPPGSRKSAVIAAATSPLYHAEEELSEGVKVAQAEAVMLRDIAAKAAKVAMDRAASGKGNRDELTAEAISAQQQAESIEVPVTPRLIADDVTPEAVGSLLAEHGGRLAVISGEGGIFDTMAGRYSNGVPSLDVWLKGHSGDPLRVDRKGRSSEYVRKPALTLLLTVQPAVLAGIARNGTFRGRGLTARFLYALPPDNVGHRRIGAPIVPDDVAADYDKRVRSLALELSGWTDPAVLLLSADAQKMLLRLEGAIEPRLAKDGEYGPIREWASKLVGAILRIAALLHIAEDGERFRLPISVETLERAILLGSYYVDHAQAAFDLLGDGGVSDAAYLLEFLRRRGVEQFTIRSLLTDLPRGRFANADEVTAAVEVLVDNGWVIPEAPAERKGPGRRPSPSFGVHPNLSAESAESAESTTATRPVVSLIPSAKSAQSAEPNPPTHSADTADIAETSTVQELDVWRRSGRRLGDTA